MNEAVFLAFISLHSGKTYDRLPDAVGFYVCDDAVKHLDAYERDRHAVVLAAVVEWAVTHGYTVTSERESSRLTRWTMKQEAK